MRPVEKAAPTLSGPVSGSESCVLGLDAVVLGDGGGSSGAVGRYVSVGAVSGGGDTAVSGVETVVSGAVGVCLCDLDNVSPGAIVVRVGETSLSGCGDEVVSGVDESVCSVSSVMTSGELDMCGCGSLVSDESGDVSVDDVVACGDDPLLPDKVRVGGRLSVVGVTLVCDSGVARSGRGDNEGVVGPGVAQPVWVDKLICADGSLRPEPPPMNALWLRRRPSMLLAAAC